MYDGARELQYQMYLDACAHGNRYLLPQRYSGRLYGPPSGLDLKWEAADALVSGGYAQWLPPSSSMRPGFTLTGKPLADPRHAHGQTSR